MNSIVLAALLFALPARATPLHDAALKGDAAAVKALLDAGADPAARNADGNTPLHDAAWYGHAEAARLLLERGADANARGINSWTPLHVSVIQGHAQVAGMLLDKGADPGALDSGGQTPWMLADARGYSLLSATIRARTGKDPAAELYLAAKEGDLARARALLAKDPPGREAALRVAAYEPKAAPVVELLLEKGVPVDAPDSDGSTALMSAAFAGNAAGLELLLKKGAAADARDGFGCTALHVAARAGQAAAVKTLLAAGAAVDARCKNQATPLRQAKGAEAARALLAAGAAAGAEDEGRQTPLHGAAMAGDAAQAAALLEKGAAVDARDKWQSTPLHRARSKAVAELLLSKGADPRALNADKLTPAESTARIGAREVSELLKARAGGSRDGLKTLASAVKAKDYKKALETLKAEPALAKAKDDAGWTALHLAARSPESDPGAVELVKALLAAGAPVDALITADDEHQFFLGAAPLHVAADADCYECARALVEAGADVRRASKQGTALHSAAFYGNKALAELLLARGADPGARGRDGRTPLHQAAQGDKPELAALLLRKGASVDAADDHGVAALHLAAIKESPALLRTLLLFKPRLDPRDAQGKTPLSWADPAAGTTEDEYFLPELRNPEIIRMLQEAGAGR